MNEYPNVLKEKLFSLIKGMAASPSAFVKNPETDFTRKRKLSFETVMQLIISMGGNSIYKELLVSQGYRLDTATTSAFVQQREKIIPHAFEYLFHEFTNTYADMKTYRGYRLLASDGSSLPIAKSPLNDDTCVKNQSGEAGYYAFHLNAMYDLCNRIYIDALIQPEKRMNEQRAIADMVDRSDVNGNVIIMADRGYESYNIFAHVEQKGWYYLIRVKDLGSNGILSAISLPPSGEFDIPVRRVLQDSKPMKSKRTPKFTASFPQILPSIICTSALASMTMKLTQFLFALSVSRSRMSFMRPLSRIWILPISRHKKSKSFTPCDGALKPLLGNSNIPLALHASTLKKESTLPKKFSQDSPCTTSLK